jgi:alkanesulfonate monooxygenase SsuD/methylene tetrahydromethanopterin reductase-like flavin-dependent oxidoreductase (luciferase family)
MAAAGPRQAGRDPAKIEVTSLLPASVGDTREAALAALRPGLAFYAGFFPRYNRMLAEYGFAAEAAALADAWMRGDREAAEGSVSDALIDATSVAGTPERCRARVEAYRQSGIDVPILSPFARGPDADVTSDVIWIAGEGTAGPVRPRNADIIRGAL